MAKYSEPLIDAYTLATFSNLEAADVENFRHNYADFVPVGFWLGSALMIKDGVARAGRPAWVQQQELLREVWREGFSLQNSIRLILEAAEIGYLDQRVTETVEAKQLGDSPNMHPKRKVYPYQQAVMLLGSGPWRARFCVCGNRFVADKPGRRACSTRCAANARKISRLDWWNNQGKQNREQKKTGRNRKKRKR